jgi:ubiquinone/menaquinone biosynthesis C-methylase UbiE
MTDLRVRPRFARLVTNVVVRRPRLWALFRRPLARMFDQLAGDWDATRGGPEHLAALEAALEHVEPPSHVLDLGTGTGRAARAIARRWPAAEVVGADVSEGMIAEARSRATGERESYVVADAAHLPYGDGSFDLVTLMNMIPFFDELARVTAPGGSVAVAFSAGSQTPIWVPLERVQAELEGRGFTHVARFSAGSGVALLARSADSS